MKQSAQGWARTRLAHRHPEEYRQFYLEEREVRDGTTARSRAASRAKTRLTQLYYDEYTKLRKEAIYKGYAARNM